MSTSTMQHPGAPRIGQHEPAPGEQLFQLASGFMVSAAIGTATKLKLADQIAEGTGHVVQLAKATQTNEDALYRMMRALASVGIFAETSPRVFANTPMSELMRSDTPESKRNFVNFICDSLHFKVYAEFLHAIRTGKKAASKVLGMEPFEYLTHDKEEGDSFHAAMSNFSASIVPAVLEAYDFSGMGTLADVAGGQGIVLTTILKKHADLRGIVFDQPEVGEAAKSNISAQGLGGRCEFAGGDFFKSVPAAENYIMKHIIHDWEDAEAEQILKNCAAAMKGKGKVILVECVIQPGNEPHMSKWLDLEMLMIPGGRERTEAEFATLFERAGMKLLRVIPTKSPLCVLEAAKV